MLNALAKNPWLVLTLVLPGLATYGIWRMILLMDTPDDALATSLKPLDSSAILATSVVFSIAVVQQAIAIAIEAVLALFTALFKDEAPELHALFCSRFGLAATGKLDENATRIIGNFFLSLNVSVGLGLLLFFFLAYQHKPLNSPVPMILSGMLLAGMATTAFRLFNAKWAVHAATRLSGSEAHVAGGTE